MLPGGAEGHVDVRQHPQAEGAPVGGGDPPVAIPRRSGPVIGAQSVLVTDHVERVPPVGIGDRLDELGRVGEVARAVDRRTGGPGVGDGHPHPAEWRARHGVANHPREGLDDDVGIGGERHVDDLARPTCRRVGRIHPVAQRGCGRGDVSGVVPLVAAEDVEERRLGRGDLDGVVALGVAAAIATHGAPRDAQVDGRHPDIGDADTGVEIDDPARDAGVADPERGHDGALRQWESVERRPACIWLDHRGRQPAGALHVDRVADLDPATRRVACERHDPCVRRHASGRLAVGAVEQVDRSVDDPGEGSGADGIGRGRTTGEHPEPTGERSTDERHDGDAEPPDDAGTRDGTTRDGTTRGGTAREHRGP